MNHDHDYDQSDILIFTDLVSTLHTPLCVKPPEPLLFLCCLFACLFFKSSSQWNQEDPSMDELQAVSIETRLECREWCREALKVFRQHTAYHLKRPEASASTDPCLLIPFKHIRQFDQPVVYHWNPNGAEVSSWLKDRQNNKVINQERINRLIIKKTISCSSFLCSLKTLNSNQL